MIPEALEDSPRIQNDRAASGAFPAPVKGWNTADPLPNMPQGYAISLDNWIPRQYSIEGRGGMTTLATMTSNVVSLLTYESGTGTQLLASTSDGLLVKVDRTTGAKTNIPDVLGDGFVGSNPVRYTLFTTPAGRYTVMVNGSYKAWYYAGGTTYVSMPIIGPAGAQFNVSAQRSRLWYTEQYSLSAWYGAVYAITGALTEFPLGTVFKHGGQLVNISSWSIDGGAGLDDLMVFVTSEGEVAIYSGSDPDAAPSASGHFSLVGIYRIPKPIGYDCTLKYGGDLLILTVLGPYLLSKSLISVSTNQAVVSDKIASTFISRANDFTAPGWMMRLHSNQNLLWMNGPSSDSASTVQYVMNTLNGAWARFTGMALSGILEVDGTMYGGLGAKVVKLLQNGSNDLGALIQATLVVGYSKLGASGRNKHVKMVKPTIEVSGNVIAEMAELIDYSTRPSWYNVGYFPIVGGASFWGIGKWGTALWSEAEVLHNLWYTIPHSPGRALAWGLRCTYGTANMVKLSAYDLVYEVGGVM